MKMKQIIERWGLSDKKRLAKALSKREKRILSTSDTPLPINYKSNVHAAGLHPQWQTAIVQDIVEFENGKAFTLHTKDDRPLAYFRAGQSVAIPFRIGDVYTTRPYSLTSSPKRSTFGEYEIAVKKKDGGFVSDEILKHWKKGDEITMSGPEGNFFFEPIRDERKVVALAGGSGITPFVSMAEAVADKTEDFDLTILYGVRRKEDILYRQKLDRLARSCSRIHVAYILSDEERPFYEHGFLCAETIKKTVQDQKASYFACGPQKMYDYLETEMKRLGVDLRHFREGCYGLPEDVTEQSGYPTLSKNLVFTIKVRSLDGVVELQAKASESLLASLERSGIKVPSFCRSGVCGWCRSRLLQGQVYVPWRCDGRRASDLDFHYLHLCASYPLSDLEIEIPSDKLYAAMSHAL